VKIYFLMHTVFGPGGGVLTVLRQLAGDLARRHDVEIVSVTRPRNDPVHPLPANVKVRSLVDTGTGATEVGLDRPSTLIPADTPQYSAYSEATDRALERFFASVQDGVVVGMTPALTLAVARLARPETVRVGQMPRPFESRRVQMFEAMDTYVPRLDAFLTLTEHDAELYRNRFGARPRIEVMPNAAPTWTGDPATLLDKVVTAAGHLLPLKGFHQLIKAWVIVGREFPDWELRIFGTGAMEGKLRRQIARRGLEDKVRLMGYSTRLREELAASSLFVMSSLREAYGMVVVEAMSCGVPVVAYDTPGPASIVHDGVDGFLVPRGDVRALADGIGRAIRMDLAERRLLGAAARQNAADRSQPAITARWEALLTALEREKA
jgi:glycosyltransferase involved in cell wall biosynthesis